MNEKALEQFAGWLRRFHPGMYAAAVSQATQASQLGDTSFTTDTVLKSFGMDSGGYTPIATGGTSASGGAFWNNFMSRIGDLSQVYLQTRMQKKILDTQMKRAQQGLQPLETSQIAPTIHVGVDPAQAQAAIDAAKASATEGLKKYILPGAVVLGILVFTLTRNKKGRR